MELEEGGETDLCGDAELLHQRLLGEVELERVVGGEADVEAARKVLGQRVTVVVEEQRVVAERRHGQADLGQVVQVLQHRYLAIHGQFSTGA